MAEYNTNSGTGNTNIPFFLYGHSVGSVIAQKASIIDDASLGKKLSGLILSGPVFRPDLILRLIFQSVVGVCKLILGSHGVPSWNNTVERLAVFNEYQKSFAPNKTDFDWICRDQDAIIGKNPGSYLSDNCGHNLSWSYWDGFYSVLKTITYEDFSVLGKDLPILVLVGSEDPLSRKPIVPWGSKWKVLESISEEFKSQVNVKFNIYSGFRHEPHQDPEIKQSVFRDIGEFIGRVGRGEVVNEKKVIKAKL